MPISEHPSFDSSFSAEDKLWRYTDLLKLIYSLNNSSLYFTNLERMSSLDPYEGVLPNGNYIHRSWQSPADIPTELLPHVLKFSTNQEGLPSKLANYKQTMEQIVRSFEISRAWQCVNCWHLNTSESAAMWQVYSGRGFGVAIVSNAERLKKAFEKTSECLYFGKIQYKDYEKFTVDIGNLFNSVLIKRKAFSHEREVRIVHSVTAKDTSSMVVDMPGMQIGCDLAELVEEIIVSPHEEDWVFEEIKTLVQQYLPNVVVSHSQLMTPPN